MYIDWRAWRDRSPRTFALMVAVKRGRTMIGVLVVFAVLIESQINRKIPLQLERPNGWVILALALIAAGVGLRFAAHGCIRKKEALCTGGIYSLCRHPLYLGSILLTGGFCILVNDPKSYIVAGAYFLVFYPLAIAWEETRLLERFGEAHRQYARSTPLLIPVGRFHSGLFDVRRAFRKGGVVLICVTALLLGFIEAMAEWMPPR